MREVQSSQHPGCPGGKGRVYAPGACPVVGLASAASRSCRGLCTERLPLKALLPDLRAFQAACSGSVATPSAHRDPGGGRGHAFLPLHPGLGAAPGWSLNCSVHLLPTQSTDSAHYLNRHTNLQNLSQLLRSIKRSIKAAFAKEELPRR